MNQHVGTPKNHIELNGKKYDPATGKELGAASSHPVKQPHHTAKHTSSVDGFVSHPSPHHSGKAHATAPAAKGMHHKTTKSKTLMRGAVHRPPITAIQGTVEHVAQLQSNTHSIADHKRAVRAKKVTKSSFISRFGGGSIDGTHTTRTGVVPVKPAPINAASTPVSTSPPAAAAVAAPPIAHTAAKVAPKKSFAKELEQAQSHTQPKPAKPKLRHRAAKKLHMKPRTLSIAASAAVVLILAGFFSYQYRSYASVKVAAARSGVNAALPAQPAGFALSDKVQYKPGEIRLAYKSNSDDRNFTVTQTASAWNSESLEENFIAQLPPPHSSTLYPNGKTVFTYGNDGNNATWVSGGVWYKVEGNSALTSTQLQGIINSL